MTKQTYAIIVLAFIGLVLACGLVGCRPSNPLNQKISAHSAIDHNLWRANVRDSLSREQWDDFDEAIQEVRLKLMAEHVATLSAEVEAALWQKIHQRTLCDVMREGFEFKFGRLSADRVELLRVLNINASLRTRRGDTASANYLKELRQDDLDQIAALDAKIAKVQAKLQKYDPAVVAQEQRK